MPKAKKGATGRIGRSIAIDSQNTKSAVAAWIITLLFQGSDLLLLINAGGWLPQTAAFNEKGDGMLNAAASKRETIDGNKPYGSFIHLSLIGETTRKAGLII